MKRFTRDEAEQCLRQWLDGSESTLTRTVLSALLMGLMLLVANYFSIPNPHMILVPLLVLITSLGGMVPGAVAALMMIAHAIIAYFALGSFASHAGEGVGYVAVVVLGTLCCYVVVAFLQRGRDRDRRTLLEANQQLGATNRALEEQAMADTAASELCGCMTSLLTNMPLLAFSKDASTGRYLACNQLFADYCHKSSPREVVGLTDHDIFDKQTADHFVGDDKTALSMDEPYTYIENVPDAVGQPRSLQTTKLKFVDEGGRLCTLGMCVDVPELERVREKTEQIQREYDQSRYESLIYSHIASSLSADYSFVYCVNLETDDYVEYRGQDEAGTMSVARKARDFFHAAYHNAHHAVYEKDRESFLAAFTKENIIHALETQGRFNLIYRLMVDGGPQYMRMRATRMADDDSRIVIGVMNIDAEMREKRMADRIREERIAYARINALSGDYVAVYSVNPETFRFQEYSASESYQALHLNREGEDFFEVSRREGPSVICADDLPKFLALFTCENVMREIRAGGIFSLRYRLLLEHRPVHVQLNAALVEEGDGLRLIVGVVNIEEQVRQDEEYEYHLSVARTLANRDELTGVRNKHAYAELERELNKQIQNREPVEFAIVVFDVNGLKEINDVLGHLAGDEHLRRACAIICAIFSHSPVFRIGGDEFVVVARESDYRELDKLMEDLQKSNQRNLTQVTRGIVIACGMARYAGEQRVSAVFQKADKRMYEDKRRLKG